MSYQTLEVTRDRGVGLITLCRPDRLNAYSTEMGAELYAALHELDSDDAVRAIVVTGSGRTFCAGADLSAGGDTFAGEIGSSELAEAEERVKPWNMRTPVIAAVNGPAIGIGATLPLQWDIRIAADTATFGFVFTRRGIVAEAGSTWILPRLIGFAAAAEVLITGRTLTAHEARNLGLVSRVVPPEELLPTAFDIARDIEKNTAPVSVAVTKRLLWHQLVRTDPRAAKAAEDALFEWLGGQPDAAEGVQSFLDKRTPHWTMSTTDDLPPNVDTLPARDEEE